MKLYRSEMPFQTANAALLVLVAFTMIAPLVNILAISFSSPLYANAKLVGLWPIGLTGSVYAKIFTYTHLWRAMGVSVYVTVAGTVICLALSSSLAYALSRPAMRGRKAATVGVLFTFVFTAPLIPTYLVVRALGFENHLSALIVPGALGAYYVLIMKTFFQGISCELFDAARIDGAGEARIFLRIVLPLSTAVLATIALFHAVGQWNAYFGALIYIRNKLLHPLQMVLRNLITEDMTTEMLAGEAEMNVRSTPEQMRAGVILFATAPILIVYPFLQRYFVKGATLGSVKG